MSDDELFENWWRVHSPPGTFDKSQCKVAFIAGLVSQRVQSAQHRVQRTAILFGFLGIGFGIVIGSWLAVVAQIAAR